MQYVALGSSMAAGPGLGDSSPGRPRTAGQSQHNYAHLVATAVGAELTDVTSSGATTADLLTRSQFGQPPQLDAVTADTDLITITIGGNDVGYVPGLIASTLPGIATRLPLIGGKVSELLDPDQIAKKLDAVTADITAVARQAQERAPEARVILVDYLTFLPPAYSRRLPMSRQRWQQFTELAHQLEAATAQAAADSGSDLVAASTASRDHHPWSRDPWTTGLFTLPLPGRGVPFHPTRAGMRAVADLILAVL